MNINFENFCDIPVNFEDSEDFDRQVRKICKCGHALRMHGFTMNKAGFNVSQCVSCDCKKFSWSGKTEDKK